MGDAPTPAGAASRGIIESRLSSLASVAITPAEGSTTLEARWINRGRVPAPMAAFVGPFREANEVREDIYLIDRGPSRLGVKIRAGTHLDIKIPRGRIRSLRLANGTRSRLELWTKWTFPLETASLRVPDLNDPDWVPIHKVRRRRWFELSGDGVFEGQLDGVGFAGCSVELSDVTIYGEPWWTLGFEAKGPSEHLERQLQATVAHVLSAELPEGIALDHTHSMSYVRWLHAGRERL